MKKKKLITIITASIVGLLLLVLIIPALFGSGNGNSTNKDLRASRSAQYGVSDDVNALYVSEETMAAVEYYDDGDYCLEAGEAGFYSANTNTRLTDTDYTPDSDVLTGPEATPSKLIREMTMTVETVDFDRVDNEIRVRMNQMGGYFQDSTVSGTGMNNNPRSGYYVIRIPADKLDEFVSFFGDNCTITYMSENTRDVTLDYVDTQSRISSLRTEMDVLSGMLEQAEDLDTLLVLQSRITEIRYEIENYESQLRTVDNQVDYSTLTLNVNEVTVETEPEPIREYTFREKLSMALKEGRENFNDKMKNTLIAMAYNLPDIITAVVKFVIFAVIVLIIVLVIRRKIRKRKNKVAAVSEPVAIENKKPE